MEIIARVDRELWINNLRVENFPQVLYKEEAHLYFFVKGGILLFPDLASSFVRDRQVQPELV